MDCISKPSHNFNERPHGEPVSILVLHYTGMRSCEDALDRLTREGSNVSAHYLIDETGTIIAMVPEEKRAWHAGVSHWRGRDNLNDISIGVEIANPGHEWGYRPFPLPQMKAVAELCQDIIARHPIPARNVVGHSDIAPMRKEDPGELFGWRWLAEQGIGAWPDPNPVLAKDRDKDRGDIANIQRQLSAYGYGLPVSSEMDVLTKKTIIAFQRHFRPHLLAETWDAECAGLLSALLKQAT